MDEETYEQFGLPRADVSDALAYLPPSSSVQMLAVDGKLAGIQLPASVELAVSATEPAVRGDTVSNVTKPATLETGRSSRCPSSSTPASASRSIRAKAATSPAPDLAADNASVASRRCRSWSTRRFACSRRSPRGQAADRGGPAGRGDPRRRRLRVSGGLGGGASTRPCVGRVESPWERIRAIAGRVSTPLGIALRGRFLVGSRPVSATSSAVSCRARQRTASTSSVSTTR